MRRLALFAVLFFVVFAIVADAADARKVTWSKAGASTFGGRCESGHTGYRGAYLPKLWKSFAELNMGTALGGLPNGAKIRILYPPTGRKMTIYKRDIGLGGGSVGGWPRKIDLWHDVTARVAVDSCTWTGVVLYRRLL
jgi:hypothetical protein